MSNKRIYFIRHGETHFNRMHRHQYPETPLSRNGRQQARRVAAALADEGIEIILTSDLARARETAAIVKEVLGVAVEESPLLREVLRPTFLWGKHHFSPSSLLFFFWYFLTALIHRTAWRNEESVHDFAARLSQALLELRSRPEERIAVVAHRGVLAGLGPLLANNKTLLTLRTMLSFLGMYAIDNAEITIVDYEDGLWRVYEENANGHL